MRLATREQIYKIDQKALQEPNMSLQKLVEKAGQCLAVAFEKIFTHEKWDKNLRIGVWCGPGNNGADGRVMAKILQDKGYCVKVLEGAEWRPSDYDILIDALFGVGLNRDILGDLKERILEINNSHKKVIAVDIPSGLDANRGVPLGVALRAEWTLTILPAKPGLFIQEGAFYSGKIRFVDIGFPPELLADSANSVFLIGSGSARRLLPPRKGTSNKSHFGHLLVLAGSEGMQGAAGLVTEAAARMGCGYITICSSSDEVLKAVRPDFLRLTLADFFKNNLKKYSAVVVGPGLGTREKTQKILEHLQANHPKVLVDADALTVLAQHSQKALPVEWLLTPHAGELSRILKVPARELEEDRLGSVERAVRETNAHILFKGFRTVLGSKGKIYIIASGNVGLAKAGSGDILAGFVGSLMAQGLPTLEAGVLGAYLHGRIADDWLRRGHSSRTLLASDLPELLDASLRSLKKVF